MHVEVRSALAEALVANDLLIESTEGATKMIRDFVFLILFFLLAGIWLVSWAALHIAGGMIHLLLVIALISLVIHFVRRTA
jgi:hypothetical protein